jgi:hypothetical protein
MTQNSGPTGKSARTPSHGRSCSQPQASMPISRRRPPLPLRTSSDPRRVEIRLGQPKHLLDPEPGAPEHDDQRPNPEPVPIVAGLAHHPDDLLDRRRISRIALPLITGHPTSVMPGQGRRRATPTRGINNNRAKHETAPSIEQRTIPPLYQHRAETREPSLSALASTWPCESRRSARQTPVRRPLRARTRPAVRCSRAPRCARVEGLRGWSRCSGRPVGL